MVRIPRFAGTSATTPVIQQQSIDPNVATKALQISTKGIQAELQNELNSFQQLNEEADRRAIMTNELQHQANLQTALPRLYSQLSLQVSNAVSNIRAVDEQQKRAELKSAEDVYLATNSIRFQEDYLNFTENLEVKPDGSGYTKDVLEFVNQRTEQLLSLAPSEQSRLEMYSYLGKFKINATSQSKGIEKNKRIEFRQTEFVNAASSLRAQATSNPALVDTYISQLLPFKQALLEDGVPQKAVNQMLSQAIEQVEIGRIEGLVQEGGAMKALGELGSADMVSRISNPKYVETHEVVSRAITKASKDSMKMLKNASLKEQFENGFIPSNTTDHKAIQSEMFKEYLGKYLNKDGSVIEGMSPRDAQQIAVDYYSRFPNLKLTEEHKGAIASGILHGNPEVALQNALMVESLRGNPNTSLTVTNLDSQTEQEAYKIVQLNQAGLTPQEAVDGARDILRNTDPNKLKLAKEQAREFLVDNPIEDMLDEVFDTWYSNFNDVEGVRQAAIELRPVFDDLVAIHGDVEIAKKQLTARMTTKFAVSSINDTNELMPYAPEKYHTPEEMDWFKGDLGEYLNNVVIESGQDINLVKGSNDDWDYSVVVDGKAREVTMKSVQGATQASPESQKEYGIFFKDTGLQVKLEDLNPNLSPLPLGYSFDKQSHPEYIKKIEQNKFNVEADMKWRADQKEQYRQFLEFQEEISAKRGLTEPQKNAIMRPYKEFERDLNVK